jgi:cytochrome c-type biogenesis protein CcmH
MRSVLALLVLLLAATPSFAISDPAEMLANPAQEARAEAIGERLRCLVCQNESIEESQADLARDLRRVVRQRVAAGDTDRQVVAWMVARYGQFVLLRPRFNAATGLLWCSPVLALLAGGGIVWLSRRRQGAPPPPLSAAERAKLAELTRS